MELFEDDFRVWWWYWTKMKFETVRSWFESDGILTFLFKLLYLKDFHESFIFQIVSGLKFLIIFQPNCLQIINFLFSLAAPFFPRSRTPETPKKGFRRKFKLQWNLYLINFNAIKFLLIKSKRKKNLNKTSSREEKLWKGICRWFGEIFENLFQLQFCVFLA